MAADVPHLPQFVGGIADDRAIAGYGPGVPRISRFDQGIGAIVFSKLDSPRDVVLLRKISASEKRELAVFVGYVSRQRWRLFHAVQGLRSGLWHRREPFTSG